MLLTPTASGFLRDGRPHQIISGAVHYFRIRPEQWRDRLAKLAAMGCDTVETYVAWNYHAPTPDSVVFDGDRDLGAFIDLARELGLDVIVRPGPYICAEWEGGGLPGWLLADPTIAVRTHDPRYLATVEAWFGALLPILVPRQAVHGGPIVAVQVENEYGSFGDDARYLMWLRDRLLDAGIVELLVTSDGDAADWWRGGMVSGATPTVNFGSRPDEAFARVRAGLPGTPLMCMEFWHGWFDHWGEEHHTRDAAEAASVLDAMLTAGASVNFYMGTGSTNFGLWNGANCQPFAPTVTSYDYDAPIAEDGSLTPKFFAFREVIGRHRTLPDLDPALVTPPRRLPPTPLVRIGAASLIDRVTRHGVRLGDAGRLGLPSVECHRAAVFEHLGLERGALLLRRRVVLPEANRVLTFHGLRDRATVLVDGVLAGTARRPDAAPIPALAGPREPAPDPASVAGASGTDPGRPAESSSDEQAPSAEPVAAPDPVRVGTSVSLEHLPAGREVDLAVIVESEGRINFGPELGETKGLTIGVWLGWRFLNTWDVTPLPLDDLGDLLTVTPSVASHAPGASPAAAPTGGSVPNATVAGHRDAPEPSASEPAAPGRDASGIGVAPASAPACTTFEFNVADPADTFLDVSKLGRGIAYVNGFCLGRYWNVGPQQTLYVPAPLLNPGRNTITILEFEQGDVQVTLTDAPRL